jgi:hypothetical protein
VRLHQGISSVANRLKFHVQTLLHAFRDFVDLMVFDLNFELAGFEASLCSWVRPHKRVLKRVLVHASSLESLNHLIISPDYHHLAMCEPGSRFFCAVLFFEIMLLPGLYRSPTPIAIQPDLEIKFPFINTGDLSKHMLWGFLAAFSTRVILLNFCLAGPNIQ